MNERLFTRLAALLQNESVVLASVWNTRGATPRKAGSKMLITHSFTEFSIGGGLAEARVIEAARILLSSAQSHAELDIDLSGKTGSAGVCGGTMQVSLKCWSGAEDQARASYLQQQLQAGHKVELSANDLGILHGSEVIKPNARLLIVGGGHCALALCELAQHLEFDIWVFDPQESNLDTTTSTSIRFFSGDFDALTSAQETNRDLYVVLLNRDFIADIATIKVLYKKPPLFLGMMGSNKRIVEVTKALSTQGIFVPKLQAPVGIDIGAQTPHEIAVSILAQLIHYRYAQ